MYGKDENTYGKLCHYPEGYRRVRKALDLLMERHVDVKINGSITSGNIDDLSDLCSIANNLDTAWKFDTYMYPASRERSAGFNIPSRLSPEQAAAARVRLMQMKEQDHFDKAALDFLAKSSVPAGNAVSSTVKCRAGRSSYVINWQGKLRPCVMLSEPEADVFKLGFSAAWKEITDVVSGIRLSARCNSCTTRAVCQTCAACAVLETGSFDGIPEYMCRYTKETIRLLEQLADRK